jgi:hypothetical protein
MSSTATDVVDDHFHNFHFSACLVSGFGYSQRLPGSPFAPPFEHFILLLAMQHHKFDENKNFGGHASSPHGTSVITAAILQ